MQQVNLVNLLGRDKNILVDGAHNELGGEALGHFVDKVVRIDPKASYNILPITWVFAASKTKDARAILQYLLKAGDRVITVEFGPVDGMPFVESMSSDNLASIAQDIMSSKNGLMEVKSFGSDIERALNHAVDVAGEHPVVAAGSLYLVSDIFRLLKKVNERPEAVPVEDIWTGEVKKEEEKSVSKNKSKGRSGRSAAKPKASKKKEEKPKI
jgi:folylpolyglutamate synthase